MDLLEEYADYLGCQYLSDLRYLKISPQQARRIEMLPDSGHTLDEYNEAARYILGASAPYSSIREARKAIIEGLMRR